MKRTLSNIVLLAALAGCGAAIDDPMGGQGGATTATITLESPLALLGDSFSSGEGAGSYDIDTDTLVNHCHRSRNSWERIVAAQLLPFPCAAHVACSGAVIDNYFHANGSNYGEKPQQEALNGNTRLVLLTMSGNDIDFAGIAEDCIKNSGKPTPWHPCKDDFNVSIPLRLASTEIRLTHLLQDARARAPRAAIFIVTYPNLVGDDFCGGGGGIVAEDRDWLKSLARAVDDMVIRAANAAGVRAIDAFDAFAGHELCASDPWANQIDWGSFIKNGGTKNPEWLHPNAKGNGALAALVLKALGKTFDPWPADATCLLSAPPPPPPPSPPPASCPSGDGNYCGGNGVAGDTNTLYRCSGGSLAPIQVCAYGCVRKPPHQNDECAGPPPPSPPPLPPPPPHDHDCVSGDGLYCGGNGVAGDPNTLYRCSGGNPALEAFCLAGCQPNTPGVNDGCRPGTCPHGDGLYCGSHDVPGDPRTLYRCFGGVVKPGGNCARGCDRNPDGQDDSCSR